MGKRKYADPRVSWHLHIPSTTAAQVELILLDPFLGQAKFGAKSELVTRLLEEWMQNLPKPAQKSAPTQQNAVEKCPGCGHNFYDDFPGRGGLCRWCLEEANGG
jgi:hypothetical protein